MAKEKLTEEQKATKKNEFRTEVDKIFIIILVLFLACGIGYAGFTMYKNGGIKFLSKKEDKKEKEEDNKKFIDVEEAGYTQYYAGYIFADSDNSYVAKIYDDNGKLLVTYDEPTNFNRFFTDSKGNIVMLEIEWAEGSSTTNNITVHTIEDDKDKVILELEGNKSFFSSLIKKSGKNETLIGFIETIIDNNENYTYKVHYLDGTTVDLKDYAVRSVNAVISMEEDYYLYDEKYAVVSNSNQRDAKYGIIDLTNGELVVGLNYNLLRQTQDGLYIAKMDGKIGLIDLKTKKVLPYEYDFIESHDDFYVVSKDNKLSILDKDKRSVTGFEFDYQKLDKNSGYIYDVCCSSFNTFIARKIGDKYLLVINERSMFVSDAYKAYDKDEAYIISANGDYDTIDEIDYGITDDYVYFLDKDERNIHFYDGKLNHLYDISLKDYDFEARDLEVKKYGDDLLVVKVDGTSLYFDFKTGEETDSKVATYSDGGFKLDLETNTVKFDKNVSDFKMLQLDRIEKIGEKSYFINERGRFVIIK